MEVLIDPRHQNDDDDSSTQTEEGLWDLMAEDLVGLIVHCLTPATPYLSRPLVSGDRYMYAESSVGAAHFMQLSASVRARAPWHATLQENRRSHHEAAACCRVIESRDEDVYDWPLQVLRLRLSGAQPAGAKNHSYLSHTVPISKHTLKAAYHAAAKEVHPDRLRVGSLATQAMTVLNEAYRQAQLHFGAREPNSVIQLDQLGLEHHA